MAVRRRLPLMHSVAPQVVGPNDGPSYSRSQICGASAFLDKGLSTLATIGLDALGMIPGEGNALNGAQLAGGVISAGMAASESDAGESALNSGEIGGHDTYSPSGVLSFPHGSAGSCCDSG